MERERDQLLMSRVVDGDAATEEWDELTALAEEDPAVWARLAQTLRAHAGVARAVNAQVAAADSVPLPVAAAPAAATVEPRVAPFAHVSRWSGWAVAAVVGIAWLAWIFNAGGPGRRAESSAPVNLAGLPAADLLQAYLDRGRQEDLVVGEVPDRILIDTRPTKTNGGYEVLYLRQIIERTVVPDLYRVQGRDERGQPILVRFQERPQGRGM
jgi:hypothetical protein